MQCISAAEKGPSSVRITWNGQSQLLHGIDGVTFARLTGSQPFLLVDSAIPVDSDLRGNISVFT
jgi:hypothetical protein